LLVRLGIAPITGLDRPLEFQEIEAPRFPENRNMKVVRLSALGTGRFYPQEILLVLIYIRRCVDPRAIVWPEGLGQWHLRESNLGPSGLYSSASTNCATAYPQLDILHRPIYKYVREYTHNILNVDVDHARRF
jgi:hypothetical protein